MGIEVTGNATGMGGVVKLFAILLLSIKVLTDNTVTPEGLPCVAYGLSIPG